MFSSEQFAQNLDTRRALRPFSLLSSNCLIIVMYLPYYVAIGRQIWIDGLERGINTRLSLAFCNFIGPPGFLAHVATCLLSGKGLPPMGYKDDGLN